MKRKIWAMFLVIFVFSMITFVFFGCGEKNPYPNRQHITMLIVEHEYDKREDAYCELNEQENHKTIEIEFDGRYRYFRALALFDDGTIKHLTDENRITCDVMHYISPEGEIDYSPKDGIYEIGTYEIRFVMKPDSTLVFPFTGRLTVNILPRENF